MEEWKVWKRVTWCGDGDKIDDKIRAWLELAVAWMSGWRWRG